MPFMRYANARVVHPRVMDGGWDRVRVASGQVRTDRDLVNQASKILQADFSPSRFLLTHATIVASVDTESVPGIKVGSGTMDGKRVIRKTANFRVKPECDIFINNNLDSWARPVLMKSYKTFIGGHSFLEHVQVEELSKGRILDAVARDVGDSVYIDILIANDRKHTQLISDIESGKINTLSMGCSIDGSTCTKCGHWAADETEMCEHVRYQKGNTFYDERGVKHRIAELCGDESLDPTGGVTFIEASWVEVPAFKGAVARNIVSVDEADEGRVAKQIFYSFHTPAPQADGSPRLATLKASAEWDEGGGGEPDGGAEEPPAPTPEPKSPFKEVEEELTESLIDKVKDNVKEDIAGEGKPNDTQSSAAPNDSIVKQARLYRQASQRIYQAALRRLVASATQDVDLVEKIASLNEEVGIFVPQSIYRAGLQVGPTGRYATLHEYMGACTRALGRIPLNTEARTLIRLGSLLSAHSHRHSGK